jgi:hypothetical protein
VTTTHKAATLFVALTLAAPAWAQGPALPASPQTINVIDVAGNLALTQKAIEKYRADHAKTVSRITFIKAPAPELAGKIKAQQNAGRVDIDLVLRLLPSPTRTKHDGRQDIGSGHSQLTSTVPLCAERVDAVLAISGSSMR